MAIVLFAVAGLLVGGTIQLVKSNASKFSIGLTGVLAALAAAGAVLWMLPGDK